MVCADEYTIFWDTPTGLSRFLRCDFFYYGTFHESGWWWPSQVFVMPKNYPLCNEEKWFD